MLPFPSEPSSSSPDGAGLSASVHSSADDHTPKPSSTKGVSGVVGHAVRNEQNRYSYVCGETTNGHASNGRATNGDSSIGDIVGDDTASHSAKNGSSSNGQPRSRFELFVIAHESEVTKRACRNLESLQKQSEQPFDVQVIDILERPERAIESRVYIAPTLIEWNDTHPRRLVGDLSDLNAVREFLSHG